MSTLHSWKAFLVPKLHRVIEFLTSQGITMAGNLFYGFLCVRLLPISEYAKFAVVFSVLGTVTVLMDISFSSTLLPLIGERIDDRSLIADYVASVRQLAHWLYLVMAPATVIVYPLLVRKQHWSWQVVTAMAVILLVASWCARVGGAYGAVLIVRRDRGAWYRAQMVSSLGTLGLLGIVWAAHFLNAFSAILINVAGIIYVAVAYYFRARRLLGTVGQPSREKRKAIIHLALPNMPGVIFYAFQGQVALLLITWFGHTTAVASVGALSRLGQIFALFSQMTPLLIEPYFAKLPADNLKRNYLAIIAVEGTFCFFVSGAAYIFPQLFLWVLGRDYSGLKFEVLLMIASSAISYFCSVLWVIHGARRFVYWWNSITTIVLTLAVQVFFIVKVDLSTVRAVLTMNLWTAYVGLLVTVSTGIYGFVQGPRRAEETNMIKTGTNYA